MSEFQTSLLVIGALAVAGVFAYNKWQEYRAGRAADDTFKSRHPDVLIGGQVDNARGAAHGSEDEPLVSATREMHPVAVPAGEGFVPIPHARIDYVIELEAAAPVSASAVADEWKGVEQRFSHRATLAALAGEHWVSLSAAGASRTFEAALQLVSRSGVVSEGELLEFRSAVETLAGKLGFSARAPEMRDALDGARALDGMCAEADIQVAFHVVAPAGDAFAGTKVRASAEAAGFVLDSRGSFSLPDENGRELYQLADRSGLKFSPATMKDAVPQALTLSMDVPRAPETQRTFDSMVRFGRQLANLLGGVLVDDNNQPLDERAVAAINAQLAVVRRNLEAQGIAPGSALALRLFS